MSQNQFINNVNRLAYIAKLLDCTINALMCAGKILLRVLNFSFISNLIFEFNI